MWAEAAELEREDRPEKTATKATVTAAASAAVLAGRSSGSSMGALPAMTHTAIASLAEAVVHVFALPQSLPEDDLLQATCYS